MPTTNKIIAVKEIVGAVGGKRVTVASGSVGRIVKRNNAGSLWEYLAEFDGLELQVDASEIAPYRYVVVGSPLNNGLRDADSEIGICVFDNLTDAKACAQEIALSDPRRLEYITVRVYGFSPEPIALYNIKNG